MTSHQFTEAMAAIGVSPGDGRRLHVHLHGGDSLNNQTIVDVRADSFLVIVRDAFGGAGTVARTAISMPAIAALQEGV